jgi:hypothetical protein
MPKFSGTFGSKKTSCLETDRMSNLAKSVVSNPAHALTFDVVVSAARGASRHRVTISAKDVARWAKLGTDPSHCVEAAMRFLTDHEPKEAILGSVLG